MKVLLLAVVLMAAGPVWGQDLKTAAGADPGAANWSQLGPSIEGTKGYTLFGRGIRLDRSGQYELWVKIVPENTQNFVKRYSLPRTTVYVMQHATVDCEKRLLLLEILNITRIGPSLPLAALGYRGNRSDQYAFGSPSGTIS